MQDESLPGARLRRAREEKGLSREDVARDLRLSMAYFKALEDDNYDKLPEPPFVKGYLRNYARLLGLSGEEFASQFQQYVDRERADVEDHSVADERRGLEGGRQWRLLILAALVVVLIVVVVWWLWPSHQTAPAANNPVETSASGQQESAPTVGDKPSDGDAGVDAQAGINDDMSVDASNIAGQGVPITDEAPSASTAPAQAPQTAPADAPTSSNVTDSVPTATEDNGLVMKFSRVCWVKVVDNNGKTLTEGRQDAGSAVSVDGEAPFRVTIGDAGAVSSVAVNGTPTTLPSQRSGDVLHVTLP